MRCKRLAIVGAGIAWGVCIADLADPVPLDLTVQQQAFALSVALITSAWVLLCAYRRPLDACYELGYRHGRRDATKRTDPDDGCRVVPLRRVAGERQAASLYALDA